MSKRGTTVYCLLSVCSGTNANRPYHEVVVSGSGYDTDSDESAVD